MKRVRLVAHTNGFTLIHGNIHTEILLDSVSTIVVYKLDEITTDLICLEITVNDEQGVQIWTIYEDIEGFDLVVSRLEALPGFSKLWKEDVVFPPFAPNRTTVFQR